LVFLSRTCGSENKHDWAGPICFPDVCPRFRVCPLAEELRTGLRTTAIPMGTLVAMAAISTVGVAAPRIYGYLRNRHVRSSPVRPCPVGGVSRTSARDANGQRSRRASDVNAIASCCGTPGLGGASIAVVSIGDASIGALPGDGYMAAVEEAPRSKVPEVAPRHRHSRGNTPTKR